MTSTTKSWTPVIGFIGLGNMGAKMARCIHKAGYRLVDRMADAQCGQCSPDADVSNGRIHEPEYDL
jgi:prephenate dehydrogenase